MQNISIIKHDAGQYSACLQDNYSALLCNLFGEYRRYSAAFKGVL